MGFPKDIAEKALVACGRCCTLCRKFCGIKIELHHIVQKADGGADDFDNCMPLCLDCHAEVKAYNPKHPKGRKFGDSELKKHRDGWYQKMQNAPIPGSSSHKKLDLETYNSLLGILPMEGSIYFVREHNFGFSFETDNLNNLDEFIHKFEIRPDLEFIDPGLESLRSSLYECTKKFLGKIGTNTFPKRGHSGRNEVPPEWEENNYDRFIKVIDELHDLTTQITDTYDSLVRTARRSLMADSD